jgi:hypothetical protein
VTGDGHRLGTVNVIDREPREVTRDQAAALTDLAAIVMDQLELRLSAMRVVELERRQLQQVEMQKARIERTVRQLKQAMPATGDAPVACQRRRGGSQPYTGPVEVKVVDLTGGAGWECTIHAAEAITSVPGTFLATHGAPSLADFTTD